MSDDAAPSENSSSSRFLGNAAMSTVLHFSSTLVVLAIAPYALHTIGLEQYGLWALLNTVTRYSLLADFGIGPSVSKHVAQFSTLGDRFAVRSCNTIGTLYYAIIAVVILAATILLGPTLLGRLALSPHLRELAPHLLVAFMGSYLINMVFWMSPSAALTGLGLFRYASLSNAVAAIVYAISAVLFLHFGFGVYSLIDASYVQIAVSTTIGTTLLIRHEGFPLVNPFHITRARYKEILGFGGWLQISTIAWLVISDTPAIVVGYFVGVEYVGILDIGTRLARAVKALAFNFNMALLPTLASRHAEGGTDRVGSMLPHAMRMMGFISSTATGLLIGGAPIVLPLWLGTSLVHESLIETVLTGLAITYTLDTLTDVAATAARGLSKPRLEAWYCVTYAVTAFAFSVTLTRVLGLLGIVLASFFGVIIGSTLFFMAGQREQAFRFADLVRGWLPRLFLAQAISIVATFAFSNVLAQHISVRPILFIGLVATGLCYGIVFLIALRLVRFFSSADLSVLERLLPAQAGGLLKSRFARTLFCAP